MVILSLVHHYIALALCCKEGNTCQIVCASVTKAPEANSCAQEAILLWTAIPDYGNVRLDISKIKQQKWIQA
jgi:hypothetical protein